MDVTTFSIWDYIPFAMAITAVLAVFWAIGGRRLIGGLLAKLLPRKSFQKGEKVHIYLDGKYNRTATLTKVVDDGVYIYDAVKLPLNYRGRFYGIGDGVNDNSRVVYITKHSYFRLIRVAELIRKVFDLLDDDNNLIPDYEEKEQITPTDNAGEGEGDEC